MDVNLWSKWKEITGVMCDTEMCMLQRSCKKWRHLERGTHVYDSESSEIETVWPHREGYKEGTMRTVLHMTVDESMQTKV